MLGMSINDDSGQILFRYLSKQRQKIYGKPKYDRIIVEGAQLLLHLIPGLLISTTAQSKGWHGAVRTQAVQA